MWRPKLKTHASALRQRLHFSRRQKRWALYIGLGLLGIYVLTTLFTWGMYRNKFFPRSVYSGKLVGNSSYNQVVNSQGLPDEIQLNINAETIKTAPKDIGVAADPGQTTTQLQKERRVGPGLAFRLFAKHVYPLGVTVNDATLNSFVSANLAKYEQQPKDAHLTVDGETVKLVTAEAGKSVDTGGLKQELLKKFASNNTSFTVPFTTKQANTQDDLQTKADSLNAAVGQAVKINYTGGSYTPTRQEKAAWLSPSGNELVFDKAKIATFLGALQGRLGQSWDNSTVVAGQISDKLSGGSGVTVSMHDKPKVVRTYNYCVALRNVSESFRAGFAAKIRSTFTDPRGWGLNGKINFVEASSGCDFTIWLSAANDLPGFGPGVCDNYYSCTVSPNVIINFDRWQGATNPWNVAGGSLEDYRVMVINHETGHWLGFGHRNCPGAGQPAPVMQQQSISLQGCTFNPWPVANELSALAQLKGV